MGESAWARPLPNHVCNRGNRGCAALTVNNLKQAYPDNHRFHDGLDQTFAPGGVEEYDAFHKMFKVNRLLMASENR